MATEKLNETQEQPENGSLADFNFDTEQTFFGVKENVNEETSNSDVFEEIKEEEEVELEVEEDEKDKKEKPKKEDVEEEPIFFEEDSKDKDKSKGKSEEENEEVGDKFYSTLALELKEKGIFQNVEIKEGEELDEDKFFELQDKEIESRVEETFEAFFEELDEDGKAFLKFKKNGGKTQDFLNSYTSDFELESLDSYNENQRDYVLEYYLVNMENMDADEAKDRVEWLKEKGKDKDYAETYFSKIQKNIEDKKAQVQEAQALALKTRENSIKEFNKSLEDVLNTTDKVGDFTFTKDEQKDLASYITKPSVKIGKNKYVPAFQSEIGRIFKAETEEDKKKLLLIAKLVKTNFDVSNIVKATKSKTITDAKSKLEQAKAGVKVSTSGTYSKKTLSDYFPE